MQPDHTAEGAICILGAGPHGLATALHLLAAEPDLRDEIVVLDPTGEWLSTWEAQFDRLGIDVLRSPIVHHPSPRVDSLSRFVGAGDWPTSGLPYDPPMAAVFSAFCRQLVADAELDLPLALKPDRVSQDGNGLRVEAGEHNNR